MKKSEAVWCRCGHEIRVHMAHRNNHCNIIRCKCKALQPVKRRPVMTRECISTDHAACEKTPLPCECICHPRPIVRDGNVMRL